MSEAPTSSRSIGLRHVAFSLFVLMAVFVVVGVIIAIPAVEAMGLVGFVSVVWSTIAVAAFLPSFLIALHAASSAPPASPYPSG